MAWILRVDSVDGTNAERRIKEVLSLGDKVNFVYKLKDNETG